MNITRHWRFLAVLLAIVIGAAVGTHGLAVGLPHAGSHAAATTSPPVADTIDLVSAGATIPGATHASPSTDALIRQYQNAVKQDPHSAQNYVNLALGYMQKERETTDVSYYTLTNGALQAALAIDPKNMNALTYKAWVDLGRHDFVTAAVDAQRSIALDPNSPEAWGNLGDAESNLGNYPAMAHAYQKMVDLKPSLASYNRASYTRWLYGDQRAAFQFMALAIRAGSTIPENVAWVESQLGDDYLADGYVPAAEAEYRTALRTFPHYARALYGLAQIAIAHGKDKLAVHDYQQAIAIVPLPQYLAALGDLYTAMGDRTNAGRQYATVALIDHIFTLNHVQYGIEQAGFWADHNEHLSQALHLARATERVRHDILTEDTLAWVLYKTGHYREAMQHEKLALRLGTKDALMYFHAGAIEEKLGHVEGAQSYLSSALMLNPHFNVLYAAVAHADLARLAGTALPVKKG